MNSSNMMNQLGDSLEGSLLQPNPNANIERSERMLSIGAGAFIGLAGLSNVFSHPLRALTELGIGGALLYRGVTGFCHVKAMAEDNSDSQMSAIDRNMETASASEVNNRIDPEVAY